MRLLGVVCSLRAVTGFGELVEEMELTLCSMGDTVFSRNATCLGGPVEE